MLAVRSKQKVVRVFLETLVLAQMGISVLFAA